MGVFDKSKFKTNSCEWPTPESLYSPLAQEFNFTCDVAATEANAKCETYFTKEQNGLLQVWTGTCWMNPPFGRELQLWVKKAYEASLTGTTVVCLLPAKTNTEWWHKFCMKGEIRFIKGRPKFGDAKHGLPFPLAIVVFSSSL